MELRQLRYFVTIADTLSFSEAAKSLCVTQSTLSQQLKQLEQEFDCQLFERNGHGVALTEAGHELLAFARNAINSADLCAQRMQDLRNVLVGSLNIGVTYSFSPMLTESIFAFMKQYPGVKLHVFYEPMAELMEMLRQRRVDFVLAFKPNKPMDGIVSHTLFQNYLAAIVNSSHPIARQPKVTLDQLAAHALALPSCGLQARNALEQILERYPHDLNIRLELNDPNILLDMVRSCNLVSVLAEASIHGQQGVKAVPIDVPGNEMNGCVHTLANSYHKNSMQAFIKLLSESLAVRERATAWLLGGTN